MNEHPRDVSAVRLVFGLGEKQLHRPANSAVILCDQQRSAARAHLLGHLTPERHGTFACKWGHETYGGATVDGVDQQVGEFIDVPVVNALDSAHRPRGTHSSALSLQRYWRSAVNGRGSKATHPFVRCNAGCAASQRPACYHAALSRENNDWITGSPAASTEPSAVSHGKPQGPH